MKIIVNINKERGIGREGGLLINIPEDMRFFRETTKEAVLIMGRKTLESFPGGRPLKGRVNIVLTRDPERIYSGREEYSSSDAETKLIAVSTKEEAIQTALQEAEKRGDQAGDEVYVVGGASVYELFLPDCDTCLITENDADFEADKYFPDIRESKEWELTKEGELRESCGVHYRFLRFERV